MSVFTPTTDQERTLEELSSLHPDGMQVTPLPKGWIKAEFGTLAGDDDDATFHPADDTVFLVTDAGAKYRFYRGKAAVFERLLGLETLGTVDIRLIDGFDLRVPTMFVCYAPVMDGDGEQCVARIIVDPTGTLRSAWDPHHVCETVGLVAART